MSKPTNFFDPDALKALGEEQRKAMTAAFEAMADWRQELTAMQEKGSAAMFDKMAEAAKSFGWPTQFVDLTRHQIQNVMKMQSQAIDQVMDTWQQQATANPAAVQMPKMPQFPGFPNAAGGMFPNVNDMSSINMPMVPLQIWMQAAEMWQKNWQQAMANWMETQKSMMEKATGGKK
jgi:hypothetical protein